MEESTTDALRNWENEGGAPIQTDIDIGLMPLRIGSSTVAKTALTGTVNQIEWAELIKERVDKEFDRVANAIKGVAAKQTGHDRTNAEALIALLEEKRFEVMGHERAGYFIHDWQEFGELVRQMIVKDPRYKEIKDNQVAKAHNKNPG